MAGHRLIAGTVLLAALAACSSTGSGSGSRLSTPGAASSPSRSAVTGGSDSGSTSAPSSAAETSATGTSAASTPAQPAPIHPLRTVTVRADTATYVIKIWVKTDDANCAGHAYGVPVITYLNAHPCRSLSRLLATTVVNGKAVGFAQSIIGFLGRTPQVYTTAGNFRTLVEQEGTGNINDLLREGKRLPSGPTSVPSPNAFIALGQDSVDFIVEAWYLDGPTPTNDPALVRMEHDVFLAY